MYKDVVNIISANIATELGFGDHFGVVDYATIKKKLPKGNTTREYTVPVICNDGSDSCDIGNMSFVTPDSSRTLMTYFEANRADKLERRGSAIKWSIPATLVVWYNKNKLGIDCNEDGIVFNKINKAISFQRIVSTPYTGIIANINNIGQDWDFFNKYGYNEHSPQFLNQPYSFVIVDLDIEFYLDSSCVVDIILPTSESSNC